MMRFLVEYEVTDNNLEASCKCVRFFATYEEAESFATLTGGVLGEMTWLSQAPSDVTSKRGQEEDEGNCATTNS